MIKTPHLRSFFISGFLMRKDEIFRIDIKFRV